MKTTLTLDDVDGDKEYFDWCCLTEVDDADAAWQPDMLDVFGDCHEAFNWTDITDVTQMREYGVFEGRPLRWHWSRIWCIPDDRYQWRWLPDCVHCREVRCHCALPDGAHH